jgi:hypothetical protein
MSEQDILKRLVVNGRHVQVVEMYSVPKIGDYYDLHSRIVSIEKGIGSVDCEQYDTQDGDWLDVHNIVRIAIADEQNADDATELYAAYPVPARE